MEIFFVKTEKDEHVFSCRRKDGTVTWKHVSTFFISHDLCHYAVETTIPLKNAFLGMVARGVDITDFDRPREQRNILLTEEAIFAEHLVNLLTIEYTQGKMENFLKIVVSAYDENNEKEESALIDEKKLNEIRDTFRDLMQKWSSLPANEKLTLLFEN